MLKDEARHDYAVIDVRRNDHGVHWFLFLRLWSDPHFAFRGAMCEEAHRFRRRPFTTISLNSSTNTVKRSLSSFTARVREVEDPAVPPGMRSFCSGCSHSNNGTFLGIKIT